MLWWRRSRGSWEYGASTGRHNNEEGADQACIYDAEGTEVAYVNNGVIYSTSGGHRIGRILGGVIYGVDGQALGRRCL